MQLARPRRRKDLAPGGPLCGTQVGGLGEAGRGGGTHRRSALRGMPRGTARRPSPWQSTLAAEQVHLVGQAAARGPLRTLASAKASTRRARTAAPSSVRPGAIVCRGPRPEEVASAGQDAWRPRRCAGSTGGLGSGRLSWRGGGASSALRRTGRGRSGARRAAAAAAAAPSAGPALPRCASLGVPRCRAPPGPAGPRPGARAGLGTWGELSEARAPREVRLGAGLGSAAAVAAAEARGDRVSWPALALSIH